jgi:hypothetical protein
MYHRERKAKGSGGEAPESYRTILAFSMTTIRRMVRFSFAHNGFMLVPDNPICAVHVIIFVMVNPLGTTITEIDKDFLYPA